MFKANNNLRRSKKYKSNKGSTKKTSYEEDYNEIILNDLVDKSKEDNNTEVEENQIRKPNKRKKINLNLGKKKTSNSPDKNIKKEKTSNKKYKSDNDQPKEIIDINMKAEEHSIESNTTQSSKKNMKNTKKSKKKANNNVNEEKINKSNKKSPKKQHKKEEVKESNKKKPSKKSKKEDMKTKSVENIEINDIENIDNIEENINEQITEPSIFRSISEVGIDENTKINEDLEKENEYKFNDIVWSDDKFPKD